MDEALRVVKELVVKGELGQITPATAAALAAGHSAEAILKQALIPAMDEVGRQFELGNYYVPEMLVSARTMQRGLEVIQPLLVETGVRSTGTVVIGTVKGDLHDIGKNLVAMMLEGAGFAVHDLGVDVAPQAFVQAVGEYGADLVALSALLTTTLPSMPRTLQALDEAGLRARVGVMVGGAPVTQEFADQIGADGYAGDASRATEVARRLVHELRGSEV